MVHDKVQSTKNILILTVNQFILAGAKIFEGGGIWMCTILENEPTSPRL